MREKMNMEYLTLLKISYNYGYNYLSFLLKANQR